MQREAGVRWGLVSVALLAFLAVPAAQADNGLIGPQLGLLNNGRELRPAGRLVDLGNFPTGGAVTPNRRFYWTVSTGRGHNDIRIVSVRKRQVVQTLRLPGASGHPGSPHYDDQLGEWLHGGYHWLPLGAISEPKTSLLLEPPGERAAPLS